MENLIRVPEAAKMLGIAEATVRKYVHFRILPHVKIGDAVCFRPSELETFIQKRAKPVLSASPAIHARPAALIEIHPATGYIIDKQNSRVEKP